MQVSAMCISIFDKTRVIPFFAGALALGLAAPVAAQDIDPEDVKDVVETPLEDLGLSKEDVPEILISAAKGPYSSDGLNSCNALVGEIAKLDTALGPDLDLIVKKGGLIDTKKAAKSVVV